MSDDNRKIGPVYRLISQDLYATDLHSDEMGMRQAEIWRAKSRQFSKDAEIIGKITEAYRKSHKDDMPELEKEGFIILRDSLWNNAPDELSRRLVLKLFSNKGGWIATLEEMVAEEYALSFTSGLPIVSFVVMTKENEIITHIRQTLKGAFGMESFSFYLLGPNNTFDVFRIERKRVSAGTDYKVIRLKGKEEVAEIDSKLGDIGGEFQVKIKDPVLAKNQWFCRILQCFAVMNRYRDDIKEKVENGLKKWSKGKIKPVMDRYEVSLLANPRKLSLSLEELDNI
ncbi:MAG: hypothetical protein PVG65_05115 [Candidatus Thorarchaeota archaeon]|jgi:hypothetical protein